jgi:hypothetical protein
MFDPYRKWLGIPPKDQPPNHYRLLGVELYENDLDVIEGAAERQMSFVRQYQSGEYAADAAKILNELAMARLCLLKPATKTAYDEKLRQQLAPLPHEPDFADLPMAELPKRSRSKKSKASGLPPHIKIIGGVGIALCLLAVFLMSPRRSRPSIEPSHQPVSTTSTSPANTQTPPLANSASDQPMTDAILWSEPKLATEPAGAPIDLLKAVDLSRDAVQGEWQQTSDALIGPANARVYLPTKVPEDYQLKISARRLEGVDGLQIGFMMAGRQGIIAIDGWNSTCSGLYVDESAPIENRTAKKGSLFKDQSAGEIVLTVHPGHLHVRFDNATVIDWHGKPERLYLHPAFGMASRESTFLAMTDSKYVIESAKIIPIKPAPPRPWVARLDRDVDVLPLADPDRDSAQGIWALNKNSLSSPEGHGKIYLPTVVPEEYTLSTTVEWPEKGSDNVVLGIGLPVSKSICQLTIVNNDCLGIDTIDGRRWNANESRRSGSYLKKGTSARIDCTVTKGRIRCEIDGRTLVDWQGDPSQLSVPSDWVLADARRLYLGAAQHLRFRDIKIGPPRPPALPSQPSFAVGKEVDLLALVDPERDTLNGKWEKDGTSLRIAEGQGLSRLVIPVDVPVEYKLTARVIRDPSNKDELNISLPFAGSQADLVFDNEGTVGGLHLDFKNINENETTYRKPVIPAGVPADLTFWVRRTGLKVTGNDGTIIDWTGNPDRATWHWNRTVPNGRIVLGSWFQKFRFEKLTLEALPPSSFPPVPPIAKDGKLLPILDAKRDSRLGEWKLDSAGLVSSTDRITRFRIPVAPPEKYVLSATVQRLEGPHDLYFGLIVSGHCCAVPLDSYMSKTGLDQLDGKRFLDGMNFTQRNYSTPLFPLGKTSQVRCYVLPDTIVVRCGDLDVVRWHGDPRRLSQDPNYYPPRYLAADRASLWFGTYQTSFRITDLELKPLTEAEEKEIKEYGSDVFPTKPQLDVPLSASSLKATVTTISAAPSGSWLLKRKPDAKALLLMNDGGDQEAAIEACRRVRLPFDLYPEFPKTDYSNYSLVVVGTNMMDHWGQPANKHPDAFKPLADFVQSGGHLLVFNAYNGRNMEHLIPLGITTGFNHSWTFEKVPGVSDILFNGAEDLIPAGNYLQQAGNFTVQKPHVVMLRRGPGSFAGEPAFATLPHGNGRLTYSSVEPGYGEPPGYWLFQAAIRWAARGAPVTAKDLEQLNAEEAESPKPSEPPGKKLEILEAKYGVADDLTAITPAVSAGAKSGRLMMAVDSSLIGRDPKNGVSKFMLLRYRLNGIEEFRQVPEYQSVVIEARNASNNVTDNKFKLIEVRWGVGIYSPNNGIDVTRKFKPLVSRNGLHLTQEAQNQAVSGLPDPKYGVTKSFYVQYQYQGQERGAVFARGALIDLGDPPEKK